MIVGTTGNPLSNIMRDLKRHSSESLHNCISKSTVESRREWLLEKFEKAGKVKCNKFQL
jgi:hypothetical protein